MAISLTSSQVTMASALDISPRDRTKPIKGPIAECIVCQEKISQKSIKSHFIRKHKGHDYEDQKKAHEVRRRLSKSPKMSPRKGKLSPVSPMPMIKNKEIPGEQIGEDRSEVIVACVICYEMMSTKSMKGHFARHHPHHNYEAMKSTMSGASPMKGNAELVHCAACKELVSCRTLKVHISKNHPDLDCKATLKASREGVVKVAKSGTVILRRQQTSSSSIQISRATLSPTDEWTDSTSHSEPRPISKNSLYPCIVCKKEVVFHNMKKHFNRIHPGEMSRYQEMKSLRTAERSDSTRVWWPKTASDPGLYSNIEVNNNGDEEYAQSALMKEVEQEMVDKYGIYHYSHLLGQTGGCLQVQVTEKVIRFDTDDEDEEFTEINPPSSKVVPIESAGDVNELVDSFGGNPESRKRKISEVECDSEDQDVYNKHMTPEDYIFERHVFFLQEHERHLQRKMLAYQTVMERKMREFQEKLNAEYEMKTKKFMDEAEIREMKIKEKFVEYEQCMSRMLEELRERGGGDNPVTLIPSPPISDHNDKSEDSSKTSTESDAMENSPLVKNNSPLRLLAKTIESSKRNKTKRLSPANSKRSTSENSKSSPNQKASPRSSQHKKAVSPPGKQDYPVENEGFDSFLHQEEDMNMSYVKETEEESFLVPIGRDNAKPKSRKTAVPKKVTTKTLKKTDKSGKMKQKLAVKMKAVAAAAANLTKRKMCIPCGSTFRDSWDYKKHCLTKKHLDIVKNKKENEDPKPENHSCDDYGCLICGLKFRNREQVRVHINTVCRNGNTRASAP